MSSNKEGKTLFKGKTEISKLSSINKENNLLNQPNFLQNHGLYRRR